MGMARGHLGTGGQETEPAAVLWGAGRGHLLVSRGGPREPGVRPEPRAMPALGAEGGLGPLQWGDLQEHSPGPLGARGLGVPLEEVEAPEPRGRWGPVEKKALGAWEP